MGGVDDVVFSIGIVPVNFTELRLMLMTDAGVDPVGVELRTPWN